MLAYYSIVAYPNNMLSAKPRAILIDIIPPQMNKRSAKRRLLELESLTKTYGGIVIIKIVQKRAVPDYKTYIGKGKLEELIQLAKTEEVKLLIFNNQLKPHQLFEVEKLVERDGMFVWDRIDLILKIFQLHADTTEAKLQIRLAGIKHMGPRIFRMGLELSQQAGGIGTRGVGETNIEIMKRHLAEEERTIKKQLEKFANARGLHRKRRNRIGFKTISIVGYTNAGKSSLLNALTNKGTYVADELFATLDTRIAKLWIVKGAKVSTRDQRPATRGYAEGFTVLLSDTIGFIQDLPPQLVEAFRSTLEETVEADLILHVIDAGDPFIHEKIAEVEQVLSQLGVGDTPKIYVFNKIDLVKRLARKTLSKKYAEHNPVFVSAVTKQGLDMLKDILANELA